MSLKLNVKNKLIIAFSAILAIFILVTLYATRSIAINNGFQKEIFNIRFESMLQSRQFENNLNQSQSYLKAWILARSRGRKSDTFLPRIQTLFSEFDRDSSALKSLSNSWEKVNRALLTRVINETNMLMQMQKRVISKIKNGAKLSDLDADLDTINQHEGAITRKLGEINQAQRAWINKDKKILEKNSRNLVTGLLIGLLISLILGISIAFYFGQSFSTIVRRLSGRSRQIAQGDLTGELLDITTNDELGDMTLAMNEMSANLRSLISEILKSVEQIASASEETAAVNAQTFENVNQQQSQTTQVATAINEMTTAVHEVSENVQQTASSASEAYEETQSGRKLVESSIVAINELSESISASAEIIQQLKQDADSINSVMSVITSIAEQTNLLALNAAIEAARAGESGRGFAVVADEVRTLAAKTQESSEEIKTMLDRLQAGTSKSVDSMNSSLEQSAKVVDQARESGEFLTRISEAVSVINDMSTQIASASTQQAAVTEEVNQNTVVISEMGEKTSLAVQESSTASDEIARLAAALHLSASTFKI